jgi:hypothetical protein
VKRAHAFVAWGMPFAHLLVLTNFLPLLPSASFEKVTVTFSCLNISTAAALNRRTVAAWCDTTNAPFNTS